jgi:uncharacterized protein with GYD domain
MPTYIILGKYTEKGIANMKESPERMKAVQQAYEAVGAKQKAFYLTMGQYDFVAVTEMPDDKTAAKLALTIGAWGAVRTETVCAFTEEEYREIVASLP